jgi:hypothetical protein
MLICANSFINDYLYIFRLEEFAFRSNSANNWKEMSEADIMIQYLQPSSKNRDLIWDSEYFLYHITIKPYHTYKILLFYIAVTLKTVKARTLPKLPSDSLLQQEKGSRSTWEFVLNTKENFTMFATSSLLRTKMLKSSAFLTLLRLPWKSSASWTKLSDFHALVLMSFKY